PEIGASVTERAGCCTVLCGAGQRVIGAVLFCAVCRCSDASGLCCAVWRWSEASGLCCAVLCCAVLWCVALVRERGAVLCIVVLCCVVSCCVVCLSEAHLFGSWRRCSQVGSGRGALHSPPVCIIPTPPSAP